MGNIIKSLVVLGLILLLVFRPDGREAVFGALADAYIAVSSFVALTLAIFYLLENKFQFDTGAWLKKNQKLQVPIAAFLGALPGCGGAIMVVTQFVRGRISFGAIVATLTSTMGDAAFLLIAQEPATGLLVSFVGFFVGSISGILVDKVHREGFLCPEYTADKMSDTPDTEVAKRPLIHIERFWFALMIPGLTFGIMNAFQVDIDATFGTSFLPEPSLVIGVGGCVLCVAMWMLAPLFAFPGHKDDVSVERNSYIDMQCDNPLRRVIRDTNFITSWVAFAFLTFEIAIFLSGVDLKGAFQTYAVFVPAVAILIGFIPGCGPQILVASMYLDRYLPFSAQLGNAISNDGDALFPALALAPKASLLATAYSAIPAFIVGYGYFFLFEN